MLKPKLAFYFLILIFFALTISPADAGAQSIAYRQIDLASNVPDFGSNLTPGLINPQGIAFLSGQPFFIADNKGGHVTALDATGLGVLPGSFSVPNAAGTGFDSPTGIVDDQNSFFGGPPRWMGQEVPC